MCFGGGAPSAPQPAMPPQAAIAPTAPAVRGQLLLTDQRQGTTLLTGGLGDPLLGNQLANNQLGRKTLLG
jgi:hypothetical protein